MDSSDNKSGEQSSEGSEFESQIWCPICKTMCSGRALTHPCGHQFCFDCLNQWSAEHNSCPVCRQTYHKILTNFRPNGLFDEIPVRQPVEHLLRTMSQMITELEILFAERLRQLKESILSVEQSLQTLKALVRELEESWAQNNSRINGQTSVPSNGQSVDMSSESIITEMDSTDSLGQNSVENNEISSPKPKKQKTTESTSTEENDRNK